MDKILIIGSSNTDLIARVKRFPKAGETVDGTLFRQAMGGKGANQALAAHKLGGDARFVTCVGNDTNGQNIFKYYKEQGLDISSSLIVDDVPSGTAMIWVDETGENCIVIIPGANQMLTPGYIRQIEETIISSDLVLLQMEVPYETVQTACELAHKHHKKILLNVAPARQLDANVIPKITVLVANEIEAEIISGEKIEQIGKEAVVEKLLKMGVQTVILTMGKNGCYLKNTQTSHYEPAFKVDTVDSTAAGDTFCGALAAEFSKHQDWVRALKFATAASALCVTRMGAQPSIPTEKEVREFLDRNVNLSD